MLRLGKVGLAGLMVAGVSSACFDDPTSDLQNGPVRMAFTQDFVIQFQGDTTQVDIQLLDEQGLPQPVGEPTYNSLDPSIATMEHLPDEESRTIPGNTLFKAIVIGLQPGVARIEVTASGVTDTVRTEILATLAGGATVAAGPFGANTELTVTAPAGTTFNTTGTVSTVFLGLTQATVLSRTATTITAISSASYTGPVKIRNLTSASGLPVDSILTSDVTVAGAFFPGTFTTTGPDVLDTITIAGGALATFTTAGAAASVVTINGMPAHILTRTANQIAVVASASGTSAIAISNVIVAGATIPSLNTPTTVTVGPNTLETGEPANDDVGTAPVLTLPTVNGTSVTYWGAMGADGVDYLTVSSATADSLQFEIQWGSATADLDMYLTNAAGTLAVCGDDRFNCSAGTGAHPQIGRTRLAAGTSYRLNIFLYDNGGITLPIAYRLIVTKRN